jgi:hypothetical protein
MLHGSRVWAALLAAGVAYETYALVTGHADDTLSEATRRTFRTRTPAGRVVFLVAWGAFAGWYAGHVARSPK